MRSDELSWSLSLVLALASIGCSLNASPAMSATGVHPKRDSSWQPMAAESSRTMREADAGSDAAVAITAAISRQGAATDAAAGMAPGPSDSGARPPRPLDAGAAPQSTTAGASAPGVPARDASVPRDPAQSMDAASSGMADASSPAPSCKPGVYAGTFSGSLQAAGVPLSTITGAINANLAMDPFGGPYLNIRDLRVVGADESGNTMTVTVTGNINCTTLELEDGLLENGKYYMTSTRTELPFEGVAAGTYTTRPYAVHGTWTVTAQGNALLGGDGEFSLQLSQ